jgi:hypothetical protein
MVREGPPQPAPYPAEQMRRDRMLARLPLRRMVLMAVLAAAVIVVLALAFW